MNATIVYECSVKTVNYTASENGFAPEFAPRQAAGCGHVLRDRGFELAVR
jgi:hypothetical protein